MKLTKNFIQPIAGAMLCIFLFSCGGKNAQNGGGMVREYAVMTLQPDSMEWYSLSSTYKCNFLGADNKQ